MVIFLMEAPTVSLNATFLQAEPLHSQEMQDFNRKSKGITWTPEVCKILAFWAIYSGFGPLFYVFLEIQV